jgi:hypothetical protein
VDALEYERAALKNVEQKNPASIAVAEVYALLAVSSRLRAVRRAVEERNRL